MNTSYQSITSVISSRLSRLRALDTSVWVWNRNGLRIAFKMTNEDHVSKLSDDNTLRALGGGVPVIG